MKRLKNVWILLFACIFLIGIHGEAMAGKKKKARKNFARVGVEIESLKRDIVEVEMEIKTLEIRRGLVAARLKRLRKLYKNFNDSIPGVDMYSLKTVYNVRMNLWSKELNSPELNPDARYSEIVTFKKILEELEKLRKYYEKRM